MVTSEDPKTAIIRKIKLGIDLESIVAILNLNYRERGQDKWTELQIMAIADEMGLSVVATI